MRRISLLLALVLTFSVAELSAQICRGLNASGKNFVGVSHGRGAWLDDVDVNTTGVQYGRQVQWGPQIDSLTTEMFSAGAYAGGFSSDGVDVTGDNSYGGLEAYYTLSRRTENRAEGPVGCASVGLRLTALSIDGGATDGTYFGLPVTFAVGYFKPVNDRLDVTPYVALTGSEYTAEVDSDYSYFMYHEEGFDFYLDLGATTRFNRLSTTLGVRLGDYEFDGKRLILSVGYGF